MRLKSDPRKLTIHWIKLGKGHLYKFRVGNDKYVLIIRVDIAHKSLLVIYRKKAFYDHLRDLAYGYL
jgi:mRNA-degrading endonuclease RelE of RelBE toxin-antitoxin system